MAADDNIEQSCATKAKPEPGVRLGFNEKDDERRVLRHGGPSRTRTSIKIQNPI
jgi:hypothetical protein